VNRFRGLLLIAVALLVVAAAGIVAGHRSSGKGEARDADRDASAHVGSKPGYQQHNGVRVLASAPAVGWVGESKLAVEDTCEPYVATDPNAAYVYAIYNRYGASCPKNGCPSPEMMLRISADDGATWSTEKPMCSCTKVNGQWDPTIAVSNSGAVYASWMNDSTIVFSKSTNHGRTWSTPLTVSTNSWSDKPWMGVSPNGADVYIAYESRSVLNVVVSAVAMSRQILSRGRGGRGSGRGRPRASRRRPGRAAGVQELSKRVSRPRGCI